MRCNLLAYIMMGLFLSGCSDNDNTVYPSMHTELADVCIGTDQNVRTLTFDDGSTYHADRVIKSSVADTTLRCICSYSIDDDRSSESFKVYSVSLVPSSYPKPSAQFEGRTNSPVTVLSRWESPRYINAYISYKTTDKGKHSFSFCEDKIEKDDNGTTTAYVSLFHERPDDDPESYTKRLYISFPKYYYEEKAERVELRIE